MPNRIIRDVGLTSRKLAAASDFGERLYWRVYQAVDDFARFHADPDIIRARCFPLMLHQVSVRKVKRGIAELSGLGLIEIYRVGVDDFLRITKFDQRLRAKESKFPPPNGGQMTVMRQSSAPVVVVGVEDRGSETKSEADSKSGSGLASDGHRSVKEQIERERQRQNRAR